MNKAAEVICQKHSTKPSRFQQIFTNNSEIWSQNIRAKYFDTALYLKSTEFAGSKCRFFSCQLDVTLTHRTAASFSVIMRGIAARIALRL